MCKQSFTRTWYNVLEYVWLRTKSMLAYSGDISWWVQYSPALQSMRLIVLRHRNTTSYFSSPYTANFSICSVPDKAKLESAKPPVRIATTSQGGNPKSKDVRIMQVAGDKNEIVWQIFRTCMYKSNASTAENINWKTRFKLQFIYMFILCSVCMCVRKPMHGIEERDWKTEYLYLYYEQNELPESGFRNGARGWCQKIRGTTSNQIL